jgi:hypothetical protein
MALDVYLAGSSTQDNLLLTETIENVFATPATAVGAVYPGVTLYVDKETAGSNYKVLVGSVTNTTVPGLSVASEAVTIHKINLGGSGTGVLPLLENTQQATLNIANAIANGSTVAASNTTLPNGKLVTTISVPTTGVYAAGGTSANLTPAYLDGGVADFNPLLLQGVNQAWNGVLSNGGVAGAKSTNPINWTTFNTFDGASSDLISSSGVTIQNGLSTIWNVPVTLNLYIALQAAQGLLNYGTGHTYSNPAASCAPGAYSSDQAYNTATSVLQDGACTPSLTKAQIATILSGGISKWDSLYVNGNSVLAAATELAANAASVTGNGTTGFTYSLPTNTYVNYAQRLQGSSAAVAVNAYFLNAPSNQFSTGTQVAQKSHAEHVFGIVDSGNEEKFLDDLNQGTNTGQDWQGFNLAAYGTATSYPTALRFSSGYKGWGIGVQSTDKNNTLSKHYRFIKINGATPNQANVYSGAYDFTTDTQWVIPSVTNSNGADQAAIVQAIINAEIDPYKIAADYTTPLTQPFGPAGFLGTVSAALAGTQTGEGSTFEVGPTINTSVPVNPWLHAINGSIDNAAEPTLAPQSTANEPGGLLPLLP